MDTLRKLYIEITTQCNLNCQMCLQRTWSDPLGTMPLATFRQIMAQLDHFDRPPIIHLGGYGEPMSHPDFLAMVRLAKATGASVEVTSNGTLLNADMAEAMLDLGLDRLVVSIDGVTARSYGDIRVNGSLDQVVENLRHLYRLKIRRAHRHADPQVAIAFVAMKSNVADLPELPKLAVRVGARSIQVSNVVPHTREMEAEILYEQALTAPTFRAGPWLVDMSLPKFDLNGDTMDPLQGVYQSNASLTLLNSSLSARNDYCRFAQDGYAAVRWDGQVSPCLSLLHDHPEYIKGRRKQISHYGVGDVNAQSLGTIWEAPDYADFRSRLREFPYSPCTTCGGCERFSANHEDCSENYFPSCGGCLWAQGFIECP